MIDFFGDSNDFHQSKEEFELEQRREKIRQRMNGCKTKVSAHVRNGIKVRGHERKLTDAQNNAKRAAELLSQRFDRSGIELK
jgi:hypothetical protein